MSSHTPTALPTLTVRPLTVRLANPRGFCAGVDRAIKIVELALERFGAPVYVRHEIVHNRFVVEALEAKGAVFVEELSQVPPGLPVVFSAHGVPKSVPEEAQARQMIYVDATCPLVSKVHREAERHARQGHHIILIGHAGHPEVIGTMGQLEPGAMTLVETAEDARTIALPDVPLAYITQTTLSLDDTAEIIEILRTRFPELKSPKKEDICYATTNRQHAVKELAKGCTLVLVIGAPNSSNSLRLVELPQRLGCAAHLVQRADDIDWRWFEGVHTVGLTASASAPEILVEEVLAALRARYTLTIQTVTTTTEDVEFKLPRILGPSAHARLV